MEQPNRWRLEKDFEFKQRVENLFSDEGPEGYVLQLFVPYGPPRSEDFEDYYLSENERNSPSLN